MSDYLTRASELRASAAARIKEIQSDKDLTETAKGKRNAEIRVPTNEKLTAYKNKHEAEKMETRDKLHRQLFGIGHRFGATEADIQAAKLNYRDALFRADSIADENAALRLLGRAQMTGDKELAKAIAAVSYEKGWNRALNDYAGQSEAIQSNLQELLDYERRVGNAQDRMTESMSFTQIPETPEEQKARMSGTLEPRTGAQIITRL